MHILFAVLILVAGWLTWAMTGSAAYGLLMVVVLALLWVLAERLERYR